MCIGQSLHSQPNAILQARLKCMPGFTIVPIIISISFLAVNVLTATYQGHFEDNNYGYNHLNGGFFGDFIYHYSDYADCGFGVPDRFMMDGVSCDGIATLYAMGQVWLALSLIGFFLLIFSIVCDVMGIRRKNGTWFKFGSCCQVCTATLYLISLIIWEATNPISLAGSGRGISLGGSLIAVCVALAVLFLLGIYRWTTIHSGLIGITDEYGVAAPTGVGQNESASINANPTSSSPPNNCNIDPPPYQEEQGEAKPPAYNPDYQMNRQEDSPARAPSVNCGDNKNSEIEFLKKQNEELRKKLAMTEGK